MKKVLIVDDSKFMRRIVRDILHGACVILEADSASSALKQFEAEHPDLVGSTSSCLAVTKVALVSSSP